MDLDVITLREWEKSVGKERRCMALDLEDKMSETAHSVE